MKNTYTLVNDTTADGHIGCDAVITSIRTAAKERGFTEVASHASGRPITGEHYARLLSESSLVVVNGEGSMHHDSRACKNIAHFIGVAKENGKRVALINTSYTENSTVTAKLIEKADLISFRDLASQKEFSGQSPLKATRVVGDLSLLSFKQQQPSSRKGIVLITDSVIPARTLQLLRIALSLGGRFYPIQNRDSTASSNNPLKLLRRLAATEPTRAIASPVTAVDIITNRDRSRFHQPAGIPEVLITGRYHAVAYAIRFQIPFLYLPSNTDKIDSLLSDVGIEALRRKISISTEERISRNEISEAAAFTQSETENIRRYLQKHKREAEMLFDTVFENKPTQSN